MNNYIKIFYTYKCNEVPSFFYENDLNSLKNSIVCELSKLEKDYKLQEIKYLARGSTSICYEAEIDGRNKIIKVFSPDFVKENEREIISNGDFYWIKDDVNYNIKSRYINRFKRFVNQLETINSIIEKANHKKQNVLLYAQLSLTDLGIAIIFDRYFGKSLDDELRQTDSILDKIELIENAAQSINEYAHKQNLYHGDIKPENLFKIDFENNTYIIRNIDFDTCIETKDIENGFLKKYPVSTTPLYYDATYIHNLTKKEDVKEWIALDVIAVVKMLIYAIIPNTQREEFLKKLTNDSSTQKWYTLFKSSCDNSIFNSNEDNLSYLIIKTELLKFVNKYFSDKLYKKDWLHYMDNLISDMKILKNTIKCYLSSTTEIEPSTSIIRLNGIKYFQKSVSHQEKEKLKEITEISELEELLYTK